METGRSQTRNLAVDYGNWVSKNMVNMWGYSVIIAAVLCIISFSPVTKTWPTLANGIVHTVLLILTAIAVLIFVYFLVCRAYFSYEGRYKVQSRILDFVLSYLQFGEGRILDIGCGSGALSIKTAKKFPSATVVGIDYWGSVWNFAKAQCEKNAAIEGVGQRVSFQKGDAASLDFPDEAFDGAVSNFVFHEVQSQPDKRLVVREALRVVKKGGTFAFHDLFLEEAFYGNIDAFVEELQKDGVGEIHFIRSVDEPFIPKLLKSRFMLGRIGLLYGRK